MLPYQKAYQPYRLRKVVRSPQPGVGFLNTPRLPGLVLVPFPCVTHTLFHSHPTTKPTDRPSPISREKKEKKKSGPTDGKCQQEKQKKVPKKKGPSAVPRFMDMHCVSNACSTHAPDPPGTEPLGGFGNREGRRRCGEGEEIAWYATGTCDSFGGEHKEPGRSPGEAHKVP